MYSSPLTRQSAFFLMRCHQTFCFVPPCSAPLSSSFVPNPAASSSSYILQLAFVFSPLWSLKLFGRPFASWRLQLCSHPLITLSVQGSRYGNPHLSPKRSCLTAAPAALHTSLSPPSRSGSLASLLSPFASLLLFHVYIPYCSSNTVLSHRSLLL